MGGLGRGPDPLPRRGAWHRLRPPRPRPEHAITADDHREPDDCTSECCTPASEPPPITFEALYLEAIGTLRTVTKAYEYAASASHEAVQRLVKAQREANPPASACSVCDDSDEPHCALHDGGPS